MKIAYSSSPADAFNAHLDFIRENGSATKVSRFSLFFTILIWMVIFGFVNHWGTSGRLSINNVSHPAISQILNLCILLAFAVLFGWTTVMIVRNKSRSYLRSNYEAIPKHAYDSLEVNFGDNSVTVSNALESATYDWSLIEHCIKTEDYLHLVRYGGRRIASIPLQYIQDSEQTELIQATITEKRKKAQQVMAHQPA